MKKVLIFFLSFTALFLSSCGSSEKEVKEVKNDRIDYYKMKYSGDNFSIVLDDMKINETQEYFVHQHKYQILILKNDSLHQVNKEWVDVSKALYEKHKNDLGMEILTFQDGVVSDVARPVGYGWAVGNEKHGEWVAPDSTNNHSSSNSSGHNRVWRHSSTSPFFWMWLASSGRSGVSRGHYNNFQNHATSNRAFYGAGTNGKYAHGTRSEEQRTARAGYYTRRATSSAVKNYNNRKTRSSSRYSRGSSTRSRSGGFGK
ncbi:MAG: hypothetical protein N4A45_00310 [Flavobacteriales bacterium]|jgi:hypothetical protein|nr:hypothetical protein [Flavobacteriales bacterium]